MKRTLIIAALLIMTVPCIAAVNITCTYDSATNKVVVSYDATSEANRVRAFALDLSVSQTGSVWTGATDYKTGESTADSRGYGIFPGQIAITDGNVTDWGTPICANTYPGTKPGIGTNEITIEMGSLYPVGAPDANKPDKSGTLFSLALDTVKCDAVVTVAANTIRGGVVMENPDQVVTVNYTGVTIPFPTAATYNQQRADYYIYKDTYGRDMTSWCQTYHCDGDADGITSGAPFQYRIFTGDMSLITNNWKKKIDTAPPQADVDHKSSGAPFNYRVFTGDMSKVTTNWKKKDTNLPQNCPRADGL